MSIALTPALYQNLYSICFFTYFSLAIVTTLYVSYKNPALDRRTFLLFGGFLVFFTLYRPLTLSRDDITYISIAKSICPFNSCGFTIQGSRDWLWYISVSLLKSLASSELTLACLATISVVIKLFVINHLCKQKLLALTLLIPFIYVQYDFTQFRAGLAISCYFIGFLFLAQNRFLVGSSFLGGNFLLHTQALPSIALLPMAWLNQKKWILPLSATLFVCLMYLGVFPNYSFIEKVYAINIGAEPYLEMMVQGEYESVKVFPIGYLPILAYALWLCWGINPRNDWLVRLVGASVLLAVLLAWFFSFNPTIQTRIFEFYIAPLVLLAGNIGSSKAKLIGTLILASILYLRLELLHDWILG